MIRPQEIEVGCRDADTRCWTPWLNNGLLLIWELDINLEINLLCRQKALSGIIGLKVVSDMFKLESVFGMMYISKSLGLRHLHEVWKVVRLCH